MSESSDLRARDTALHRLLIAGDETATSRIAELFLPLLIAGLKREFATLSDRHLLETAVHDALLSYFAQPRQFDPDRLSLAAYLRMSARGDLINALKQYSIDAGRTAEIDVENQLRAPEQGIGGGMEPTLWAELPSSRSEIAELVVHLIRDETDRKVVDLMMEGVRDTAAFAKVLGIDSASQQQQRKIVKQHKDRIKKTIQRGVEKRRDPHD